MTKLKNSTQSSGWTEGYPIGNGRLAAMIWGDENKDIFSLNHEWLWRGTYRNKKIIGNAQYLETVREILKSGDYLEGTQKAVEYFGNSQNNVSVDSYQPAGDIIFTYNTGNRFLKRTLNTECGVAAVERNGITMEAYADVVKDILVFSWSASRTFGGRLEFLRPLDEKTKVSYDIKENKIDFLCQIDGGTSFMVRNTFETDGKYTATELGVDVCDATYIRLLTDIGTDFKGIETELTDKMYDFEADKIKHCNKFSRLMNTVDFELGGSDELDFLSLEDRIERIKNGKKDNGMVKILFDYGRYLMYSCSVFADLPANLQGKWNRDVNPPWSSDYHLDINLQMNYWMCEALNMSDCIEPLIKYLMRLMGNGKSTAKMHYGCRGTLLPLSDDAWAKSLPTGREYGIWIGAAAWMAQHLWWRYTYSGDKTFLREKAYPFFKATAEFYEDYLIKDKTGIYQIIPSQSPENSFVGAGKYVVSMCVSSAMDVQLAYDALVYAVKSAKILNTDAENIILWQEIIDNLPPFAIGNDGRLLEWNEEKEEKEPGHRHNSHLYGVYPSDIFINDSKKPQYIAAEKSLDFRAKHCNGHSGWNRAWTACLYARYGRSEDFLSQLYGIVSDFVTNTLLDLHPPHYFQIDGNFGAVASIIEALVSCADGKVYLLKAIPKEWNEGHLSKIKLPGGHTISIAWKNGMLTEAKIIFGFEKELVYIYDGKEMRICGEQGEEKFLLI